MQVACKPRIAVYTPTEVVEYVSQCLNSCFCFRRISALHFCRARGGYVSSISTLLSSCTARTFDRDNVMGHIKCVLIYFVLIGGSSCWMEFNVGSWSYLHYYYYNTMLMQTWVWNMSVMYIALFMHVHESLDSVGDPTIPSSDSDLRELVRRYQLRLTTFNSITIALKTQQTYLQITYERLNQIRSQTTRWSAAT